MYTLIVENAYNEQLELTHNDAYVITSIDGLDPPDATINTTKNANSDGSVFNSSYLNDRQIIITMAINSPAELNRIALYQYFKTKMPLTLHYQNASRNVYINGYVQQMNIGFFDKKQIAQIIIVCPNPYFMDMATQSEVLSDVIDAFEFPFEIESGPGKNLLEVTATSKTTNGITFTVNSDGSVTANGTATASAYLVIGHLTLISGTTYTLNGCPQGGGNSTYRVYWQGVSGIYDEGNGCNFTPTIAMEYFVRMVIYAGATVNNLTFYPMVRLASDPDPTFEPYSYNPGIEFSTISDEGVTIVNGSDNPTGCIITLNCTGFQVTNPLIYHVETNTFFSLNYTLHEGDQVIINTKPKEKNVTIIKANGTVVNGIGYIVDGSTWLQLVPGTNQFTYQYQGLGNVSGWLTATFEFNNQYEGV